MMLCFGSHSGRQEVSGHKTRFREFFLRFKKQLIVANPDLEEEHTVYNGQFFPGNHYAIYALGHLFVCVCVCVQQISPPNWDGVNQKCQ